MTRDIYFQTGNFADFEKLKIDSHFGDFRQVKIDPTCSLLLTLGRSQLYCFGQGIRLHKTIQTLSIWQKFKNHA